MNIIIGLLPALLWGIQPLAAAKIGGTPYNQIFGTTLGAVILASGVFVILRPELTWMEMTLCFLSGVFYAFGQLLQYASFKVIAVSKVMPITTGMQLTGNALASVVIFNEWAGMRAKIIGFSAIALIIIGVVFASYSEHNTKETIGKMKKAVIILLLSTVGYVGYSGFPRAVEANGWDKFFPQTVGMITASFLIVCIFTRGSVLKEAKSYQNILTGFIFAVPAMIYLVSTAVNGVATGFALSQMLVVISTLGGIVLFHEKKTRKEMMLVLFGLLLVVSGGVLISLGT